MAASSVAALVLGSVTAGAAATPKHPPSLHVKSTHFAFEGCPAATTVLSASMPRLTYTQHQSVTVNVTITNNGNLPCGAPNSAPGPPIGPQLTIGPCGDLSLVVRNGSGKNVFPGPVALACLAGGAVPVPPHTSVSTSGVWNQRASYTSKKLAPRGTYKVSIEGKLTFTITLTGSSSGPLPPLALPAPPEFAPPSMVCSLPNVGPSCVHVGIPNAGPTPLPDLCQPRYILISTPAVPAPKAPDLCGVTVAPPPSSP